MLFTLPANAPTPIKTIKSVVNGGSIYVNAGSREVLQWGMPDQVGAKVITDLVGFFTD